MSEQNHSRNQVTAQPQPWWRTWFLPAPAAGRPGGMKREFWPLAVGAGYIALIYVLGGLRSDHVFIGCLAFMDFYNWKSRLFLRKFFPFILTGVVFDSMRYYYWQGVTGHIHVDGPYYRDLSWFGIPVGEGAARHFVTPNEWFALHPTTFLDLLCGFAYLTFVGEYLAAGFFLFMKNNFRWVVGFGWSFFTVNVMGYIVYFLYPAAPPWYISHYGLGPARLDVHPESGAAVRFDQHLGTHFFEQMYGRGIDVYGAYPSLHVAYPLLVVWLTFIRPEMRMFRIPAILFYFLMCLSAVYLQHHYVVDILMGSAFALIVAAVATRLLGRDADRAPR